MTERKAIVANQASYDIMVIPREVKTQILRICQLLNITKEDFIKKLRKLRFTVRDYSVFFLPQLNKSNLLLFKKNKKV
jgi:penicillin-binding protein 2